MTTPVDSARARWESRVGSGLPPARTHSGLDLAALKRDLHATLVNNLGRIGLLTERISPRLEAFGIRPAPAS